MPPKVAEPRAVVRVSAIAHREGRARPDLTPQEFAQYMVGDGKGRDGGLPEMFMRDESVPKQFARDWLSRDRATYDAAQPGKLSLLQAYCTHLLREELPQEPRHYRVVVSFRPEDSARMDLVEFTRELMERVEADHSVRHARQLKWVGSAHYNTGNEHVHVGIRGLDAAWEPVILGADYMNKGFRWRASGLVHEVLGTRVERDAERSGVAL